MFIEVMHAGDSICVPCGDSVVDGESRGIMGGAVVCRWCLKSFYEEVAGIDTDVDEPRAISEEWGQVAVHVSDRIVEVTSTKIAKAMAEVLQAQVEAARAAKKPSAAVEEYFKKNPEVRAKIIEAVRRGQIEDKTTGTTQDVPEGYEFARPGEPIPEVVRPKHLKPLGELPGVKNPELAEKIAKREIERASYGGHAQLEEDRAAHEQATTGQLHQAIDPAVKKTTLADMAGELRTEIKWLAGDDSHGCEADALDLANSLFEAAWFHRRQELEARAETKATHSELEHVHEKLRAKEVDNENLRAQARDMASLVKEAQAAYLEEQQTRGQPNWKCTECGTTNGHQVGCSRGYVQ